MNSFKYPPYDILLSVWNQFFSPEQLTGFERAGLGVTWLGNRRPPINVAQKNFSLISWALLRAHFKIGSEWIKHASMEWFDVFSGRKRLDARLVWAYVERNNRLIRQAKTQQIPVILDVPIGHQRAYQEMLERECKREGIKPPPKFLLNRWSQKCEEAYDLADVLSVGSTFVKSTLEARGIASTKILVNPYGIDAARWKSCYELKQTDIGDDRTIFICTASIGLRKGTHHLLRAWKKAALKNAELWIVGGSGRGIDLDRLCGGLPDTVRFLGYLDHESLSSRYAQADVFVLPSLFEGLVRSGLEAMAAGLPVITTLESGLTDFIEHGNQGWVVPSANVEALVEHLRYCYNNREQVQKAGRLAHETMQTQTFESYGDRCASIAKAVINGGDPKQPSQCLSAKLS